jgi:AbrB family looped-hinge helix DNA binding protein
MSEIRRTTIRQRGQITLPAEVRRELDLEDGDELVVEVDNGRVVMTPSRARALEALAEIQAAFRRSAVTEKELQQGGQRIRREIVERLYGPG